nr:MAG TPA: hypothetical protein [Bacteriophage sp.]
MSIKLENVVLASPEQMKFVIEGMRNPMNSWKKSDSYENFEVSYDEETGSEIHHPYYRVGATDNSLMQRLANAGTDHRKYMRMMPIYVKITAPLYWWKEFDTYKVGTVANSCSTMHKITEKEFTLEDFSCEHLRTNRDFLMYAPTGYRYSSKDLLTLVIETLNHYRKEYLETKDKEIWWQMIQLLPSSYNQTRNVMLNYEVAANIYKSRKNHKLDEWIEFCKWLETLPHSKVITGIEE